MLTIREFSRRSAYAIVLAFLLFQLHAPGARANPIQIENSYTGDSSWISGNFTFASHQEIEGYASPTSVQAGDMSFGTNSIQFFVNVSNPSIDPTYSLYVFRLGWYSGAGARRMLSVQQPSIEQPGVKNTDLIVADWRSQYTLSVPATWTSGLYVALVVTDHTRKASYIPFVVRNDGRMSDYLYQVPVATWQAYNCWGGRSLYDCTGDISSNSPNASAVPAPQVSFDRPYHSVNRGLAYEFDKELGLLRFLEREGYDVTYQTDIDTHSGDGRLLFHKAFISAGHNEYWTDAMRNNVELARDYGVSIAFFGSNAVYWQIRLSDDHRTITGYKERALAEDPLALDTDAANDRFITTRWRDFPVNRPENSLIGVMYHGDPCEGNIVVSNPAHWIYTGLALSVGTTLTGLLGNECDSYFPTDAPRNVEIVARSPDPFPDGDSFFSDMTVYKWQCLRATCVSPIATIFATGSLQWVWGLDDYQAPSGTVSPIAQQMTRNIFAALVGMKPMPGQPAVSPNGISILTPGTR